MDIVKIYFETDGKLSGTLEFACSTWYHKPVILRCIACYMQYVLNRKIACVTSSKYCCRQFLPEFSKTFPIGDHSTCSYKKDLDWYVFEFNDYAYNNYGNKSI